MSNPVISVIIPTVNRKQWVCDAIDSVLKQSFKDYEIIVVDDGSTDGTSDLLRQKYGDQIRLFRTAGSNAPTAKNYGAGYARGEFIAFLDDDDLWYPEKLEKQWRLMCSQDSSVGMVGGGCDYFDIDGAPYWKPTIPQAEVTYEQCCIKVHMPGSGSNELIRKSVFEEVGGLDNSLTRGEDRDCWIKIARRYRILMVQDITCSIRIHSTPRKNVNFSVIRDCRMKINERIPEPDIRRKADAWLYYYLFTVCWTENKIYALGYLAKSFLRYPFSLRISESRGRGMMEKFVPWVN